MKIVTFGEGMIEISGHIGATGPITYGGDVLNMTVALARLGHRPAFMTALGSDAWSEELLDRWDQEGVDCSLIARHPSRVPGLYAIRVDDHGERSFTYWRDRSAARDFFALPQSAILFEQAADADLLFLSGITLSLFNSVDRGLIAGLADRVRARGGIVAFDGNFRLRGWESPFEAETAFLDFAAHATLALPTLDDEALMHGQTETAETIADRWHAHGVREVIVKLGADGAFVSADGVRELVPTRPVTPVDTSGAGDAFDAGYLAARLANHGPAAAARFGHRLAGETVQHKGAIPARHTVIHIQPDGRV
ncbi:2-dehydro-3-deoxygluconokinase [Sphingomonas vulcanisoli]|uniref:2-dehydro-3-deoxygluconokinase n=1 Tax=Sphingomonas vulcanisoli TaxID=1658060 RepID=A0ABX0TMH0_9SPHN|nr:sugar kinase [Sphingomonas vulcanisoli]NIJ06713.1 2-dehydro-3-deoxygluconokinase [Sphingomonas vulcanisoli]